MPEWNEQDRPENTLPELPEEQNLPEIMNEAFPACEAESVSDESQKNEAEEKKKFSISTLILEYVELFVVCLGMVLIVFSMIFRVCTVSGGSMLPTLKDGELLLVSNLFYEPQPGDIIIFHQTITLFK